MNYVNHLGNQPLNIIGITGSPATGKKSIGKIVADSLNYRFLDLNKIALESGGVLSTSMRKLRRLMGVEYLR